MTKWTKEQENAIKLHNRNLLVSAAAGSGKTAVLVERIVKMITEDDGVDVDELLVLTFTRAAAMEMKERVSKRISEMLNENPDNERLKRQSALLACANITTIDSFCLRIVRDYFEVIDMDPDFRIGDKGELTLIFADCMEKLLEHYYEEGSEEFLEFSEAYGGDKNDHLIEKYIKKVYYFSQSYPYPDEWLSKSIEGFNAESKDMEKLPVIKFLKDFYQEIFMQLKTEAERLLEICQEEDGPFAYEQMMKADVSLLDKLIKAESMTELCKLSSEIKFTRKSSKAQKGISETKKAEVSFKRDEIKKIIQNYTKKLAEMDSESLFDVLKKLSVPMGTLLKLTSDFAKIYHNAKLEKNILDFNDIEHLALSILVERGKGRTEAAKELREKFKEILIDEYQDSNYLQDMILESISGKEDNEPNMFMVGDVKQSIYRFRMARPEIFMEKYRTYSTEDSLMQKLDLQENFRSRSGVLDGVNLVFKRIMTKTLGDVEYDKAAALYMGADYKKYEYDEKTLKDEPLKLIMIDFNKAYRNDEASELEKSEAEAYAAVLEIKRLTDKVNGKVIFDKDIKGYRKLSYRDIVILLRSTKGNADMYLDTLTVNGIPACADALGYFDALEVKIMLSLLQITDNPLQDIPMTAVLKSPIGMIESSELAEVVSFYNKAKIKDNLDGIYPAVEYYVSNNKNNLSDKLNNFISKIEEYRYRAGYMQVSALLKYIFHDTGYYDYVSVMPAGNVRRMNLDMLCEKAASYEKTSYHGLFHFVRYMEHLKEYEVDFEQGQMFGEQDDIVRICSIHKSKGLEYPVVILGGMANKFNKQDSNDEILLHSDLGIAAKYINTTERYKLPSIAATAVSQKINMDNLGEELRVLYVAMTRARESLIMIGADPYLKTHMETHEKNIYFDSVLPFYKLLSANSYLDWILMAMGDRLYDFIDTKVYNITELITEEAVTEAKTLSHAEILCEMGNQYKENNLCYDKDMNSHLANILLQKYKYEEAVKIQSKFSVSELKRLSIVSKETTEDMQYIIPEISTLPEFMEEDEKGVNIGAKRGTAFHRVLELINPESTYHSNEVKKQIDEMIASGKIKKEDADFVNPFFIYTMYQSECGKEMLKAYKQNKLFREQKFIISLPACYLKEEWESDEPVLIQGIIDAWFETDNGIVLVDYKTDGKISEEKLIEKYKRQFELYTKALEMLTKKKVVKRYMYSFSLRKDIEL